MSGLIAITTNEHQEPCVSGRLLHEFLEIDSKYTTWFERMAEYGFLEGTDFFPILEESTGGRPKQDHIIRLDMAKELAMLQRTEKGKQARQYFIAVEKEYNSPEKIMARALYIADTELRTALAQLQEQAPQVLFAEAVSASKTSILVAELAKLITQNGVAIGQNRLFEWLRHNGYLAKNGARKNTPTQRAMEQGLFEIVERNVTNPDGSIRITITPKVTGKGQIYFINKFLGSKQEAK